MTMHPMSNFNGPAQQAMTDSYQILMHHHHTAIEVEHLLMALLKQPGEFAEHALDQLGVDRQIVIEQVEEKLAGLPQVMPQSGPHGISVSIYITPRLQNVFTRANNDRAAHHSDFVTPRDLLLAVVSDPADPAAILLKRFGLDRERLENVRPEKPVKAQPANLPVETVEPVEVSPLTHFNETGRARMVDVSDKAVTGRRAVARGKIHMQPETLALIREGRAKKGDVLAVAQVAGIMAAKKTSEIIPMCHPLMLTGIDLRFEFDEDHSSVKIEAEVKTSGQTGVEMEALTAVSAAALTIYDMVKATDKGMRIENIRLAHKSGGKSGDFEAD